jgi:predicted metal-binding protein
MSTREDLTPFLSRARELGALDALLVATRAVVTAEWVPLKCRYGCGGYGTNLCCPPHSPTPAETRRVLDCYERAILVHCVPQSEVKPLVVALERELFLAGFYKAFGYGAGPCDLCETCNLARCIRTHDARPAMEASGIDVFATVRAAGLPIEVVTGPDSPQNYFGLVLVD